MSKYVVVTFPDVQSLMDIEGFNENSYLVNDEQGIEDFGSSAYFVDEDWLNNATGTMSECDKHSFVQRLICQYTHILEDEELCDFDEPHTLTDGNIAKGFYEDDGNEDIRIVITDEDGETIEDAFLSSMPVEDAYVLAKMIDDGEYTINEEDE